MRSHDHTHHGPHVAVIKYCVKYGEVGQLGIIETTRVTIPDSDPIHCTHTGGKGERGDREFSIWGGGVGVVGGLT